MEIKADSKIENAQKRKRNSIVPPFLGIAAVWFGTHAGPGVASGKQVASYYSAYGIIGMFTPILAMALLGLAIYFAIEYSRVHEIHDFKTFTNKFFHPHEKLFSAFFEISFLVTSLLAPGLCIATSAQLLEQYFGLNIWIGTILMVLISVILVIYGAEIVKAASTALTVGILVVIGLIVFLGIKANGSAISTNLANTSVADYSLFGGIWLAITYAGFQSTGIIGNCISVSQGLKSKNDSIKSATLGTILNTVMLVAIVLVNYAYQPESINSLLPNYYIVQQLGLPILETVYVIFVIMASLSTIIAFAFSLVARYGNKEYLVNKIKQEKSRNILIVLGMLILDVLVSTFGIASIVNIGYKYLGYFSIFVVLFPFIIVGMKKGNQKLTQENE
ncbi:YkvI family membrane protein [Sedimentibacter sp. MB31-C6]|uniref:YkvI family membrane protein n=1 Tax=Sedimentibacter sp. MB31-C6 TaxID=3109366 RepID=UPI002DDCA124|nr:hypothetical protein [Sedimentibacter sp. MB36-C1]WSI03534.1 hypothetical protein U8307_10800 [Sedimentibacter sp. MB36-C1]